MRRWRVLSPSSPSHTANPAFHRPAGSAGAEAAGESDPFSRLVRAQQQVPRAGDAGQAGQGRPACHDSGSGGADTGRTPCRDDLGATPQASVIPGILPSTLRASLRLFEIAPSDLVGIDIETCPACGGAMRIIACIEDPDVIEKILAHLDGKAPEPKATRRPPCRAPPQRGLFDETG
jgi:hypothetical protein